MNSRSLSFRLVTWYAGLLTLVFILLGVLTLIFLRHYLEANVLDIQARRAQQIGDTIVAAASRLGEGRVAAEIEDLYSPEANDRFIRVTGSDGHVIYASGAPKDGSFDPTLVPLPHELARPDVLRKVPLSGGSILVAAHRYVGSDGMSYWVEVGTSSDRTEATVRQVLLILGVGLPIAVCVAVAGGFILVRRALKPVDRLSHKAAEITQHNLSERLPVMRTGDELERLSLSLNLMISRLEDAINSSKQFVADASHELRTPLAVLRGELEELAQDAQLKANTRETLGSMLEEVDRLAEIVEGLLALSRLDTGEGKSEWVRFDLAELVVTTADQMGLLAEDKSITVVCDAPLPVMIEGDRSRLKQVVVNLLDNAIKYTPSGGHITLKTTQEDGFALLDVADEGVGIPAEALPHVFKRFFRVDGSRSRDRGGAGLGLSIVKSICDAHGARVEVSSVPGRGSHFRIRQPLAAQSVTPALPNH
jgi:heavy metal sensor kinase